MARLAHHDVAVAAWELNSDRATWLRDLLGIASAVAGVHDGLAWSAELQDGQPKLAAIEGAPGLAAWLTADHAGRTSEDAIRGAYFETPIVTTMRSAFGAICGEVPAPIRDELASRELRDVLLVAPRAGDEVATLGLPLALHGPAEWDDPARLAERWAGVALHMRHALRVQQALARLDAMDAMDAGGAVLADFDERGRGSFAIPGMRKELRERAAQARRTPTRTALWTDLVIGRCSIVGYRTRAGAMRFIAVANPDGARGLRALSAVERRTIERLAAGDSQKAIALDLGIRETSVSNIARRARAKLGLVDPSHLAAVWAATRR